MSAANMDVETAVRVEAALNEWREVPKELRDYVVAELNKILANEVTTALRQNALQRVLQQRLGAVVAERMNDVGALQAEITSLETTMSALSNGALTAVNDAVIAEALNRATTLLESVDSDASLEGGG